MRSKVLVVALFVLLARTAAAQEPPASPSPVPASPSPAVPAPKAAVLTFDQALKRALEANPGVNRARAEVEVASAQKRGLLGSILPHLALTGSSVRNSDEVAFGFGDQNRTVLPRNDWNYRFVLSQPVFAGLRDQRASQQAGAAVDRARDGMHGAEDMLLLRTATDYLDAVQAEALLEVERQGLALAGQRRIQANNFYEAGESTRVDLLRAETAVKAAERRVVGAQQQLATAKGRLRIDLGMDDGDLAVKEPVGVVLLELPAEDVLIRYAEQQRAEVRQAGQGVRIAELEVAKQRGAYWPVITADAGYVQQKTTFPKDRYSFAALRFSVPIFQSGEVGARVAAARAQHREAELSLEEVRRVVREDVRTTVLALQAARTNLGLAEDQLATAEAEYTQIFELYRGQEATSLDVSASEAGLSEARRAVVTGRLDLRLAELRVWAAAGALKTALGIS